MNSEYEQYYCKSCNKLFNDLIHTSYYTLNKFVDNQNCLIDSIQYRHDIIQPRYIANCPHCYSTYSVKVKDILDKFKVYTKKGKQIEYRRLYSMTQYRRYANLHKRILLKIEAKHLNKVNDKYKGKVKEYLIQM